jgi:DNA polymerase III epsilon subunit-like protein
MDIFNIFKNNNFQSLIDQFFIIDLEMSKLLNIKSQFNIIQDMRRVFIGWKEQIPTYKHYEIYNNLLTINNNKNTKIVLDIETDGYNKIIQVCYFIIDNSNKILQKHDYVICNYGYTTDYYKKLTKDDIKKYGICPKIMMDKLNDDIKYCESIIGHNIITFDIPKLIKFFDKFDKKFNCPKHIIDTMHISRQIVCARGKNDRIKNPKLIELCNFFNIGTNDDSFHDAYYDVECTLSCYICLFELMKN